MTRAPLILALALGAALEAQQVVTPTEDRVGPVRGDNIGNYNVVNGFETGYRFRRIDGNEGKYRSDVNYGNGLRLFSSSLAVNSRDGHGGLFDEILLTTLGLGNDPYESAMLRIQKNRLYRYDMLWRSNEYFNPALTLAGGGHLLDTTRQVQDHDLTLMPQSRFKLRLGYSRNSQSGPALNTVQLFDDIHGDEFPLFGHVRRLDSEYRLGGDFEIAGIKFTWLRRWEYFKDDTPYALTTPAAGNHSDAQLSSFRRDEPYHGATPAWFANLHTERKVWAANGRFSYSGGRRNFIFDESALGIDRFGAARNRQIVVGGNARRPAATGDLALSFFPTARLTIVNNTSVHSIRLDGNSVYDEFNNATQSFNIIFFQFLGIRTVANATDVHFRAAKWLGVRAGYQYSNRLIRSIESYELPSTQASVAADQTHHTHAGLFGVRLNPLRPLTINLDAEIARADRPFYPISERNYHALSGRIRYRAKGLVLSTGYRENYNNNSIQITTHSSHSRSYSADASWNARAWVTFDASYSRLHLDTVSGIAFFGGDSDPQRYDRQSLYFSNIHAGNLGLHFAYRQRVSLYAGYAITRDAGDGRNSANAAPPDSISNILIPVQTFPLSFQSPLARLSIKLNNRLRWNTGWQYYRYREDFGLFSIFQNYRAHTGYVSLLWSF